MIKLTITKMHTVYEMDALFSDNVHVLFDTTHNRYSESLTGSAHKILMELLPSCKTLEIYEYYDGVHLLVDDIPFLLTADKDEDLNGDEVSPYEPVNKYFSASISDFKELESFSYTSRFYSEIGYFDFKIAPPKLQSFTFSTPEGLNESFIRNAVYLRVEAFPLESYYLIPDNLSQLEISTLSIMDLSDLKSFLERLSALASFTSLTIEDLDFDDDIENVIRDMFVKYIPNKFTLSE